MAKDDRHFKTIRELLERDPFVPFLLVMNSGDRIKIETPALATLQDAWLSYMLPRSNGFVQLRVSQLSFIQVDDLWHE